MKGRKPSLKTIAARSAEPYSGPVPACPSWLDADARTEWDRVAPELVRVGALTPADAVALACYCQAYSQWKAAELQVRKDGLMVAGARGGLVLHPAARHAAKLLSELRRAAAEFGFSPAARTRVDHSPKQPGAEEDTFDAL